MTEEEAKTKWCPMVRSNGYSANYIEPSGNCDAEINGGGNIDRNPVYSRCIASDCMMWRTITGIQRNGIPLKPGETFNPADEEICEAVVGGYCGLAGKE